MALIIYAKQHTDAYLALNGWHIPIVVIPVPLKGGLAILSLEQHLVTHRPISLGYDVENELEEIYIRAQESVR